jgi:putative transposase
LNWFRAGRSPEDLAKEFEPSAQAIRNWVAQADRDEGRRSDGLAHAERSELARLRKENKQLRLEREILSKAAAWFAREKAVRRGVPIRERTPGRLSDRRHVPGAGRLLQRLLCVGDTGAFAHRTHWHHPRCSHGTYGSPRVHAELAESGLRVSRKRVARLKAAGLAGVSRRRSVRTTVRDDGRQAPDLVERAFQAEAQNVLWVADITYISTWSGFLYFAIVLDAFSRRIVCDPPFGSRLAIHVHRFRQPLPRSGRSPLHGSVGDAYDNAMAESFFATLECELLDRRRFKTQAEARMAVFAFIEGLPLVQGCFGWRKRSKNVWPEANSNT